MTRKHTKRALFTSALVLLLCLSMLVGTTFAWFTDSASAGRNTIQSGNLDVVLEIGTPMEGMSGSDLDNPNNYNWTEVTSETPIFDDYALYEPGYVKTVVLRIRNNGSLALKYNLATTIVSETKGVNKAGEEFLLSDYLKAVTAPSVSYAYYSRSTLMGLAEGTVSASGIGAAVGNLGDLLTTDGVLKAGACDWITMAIVMPTTVGNEANHNGTAPSIVLGVDLVATQATVESDSFGKDYDAGAEYPTAGEHGVTTAAEFVEALKNLENGGTVVLMNDIELGDVDIELQNYVIDGTTTDDTGATINNMVVTPVEYTIDLNGYELSATDRAIDLHGGTLNIKNGTISMDSADQSGVFISVGGHSPAYDKHKVAKCGDDTYNPVSTLNLENVTFEGSMAANTTGTTTGHIIYVNCHAQVHIRNCSFKTMMDNGVYANHIDVNMNAAAMPEKATAVYVYEGTKFYGDPTFQAFKSVDNTDWEVKGGHLVYIADGYELEAAPIADGDTYAWYTVVAE